MRPPSSTVDEILARIAEDQHGVVTRTQLLAAGLSRDQIKRRLRSGGLLPEYRGTYRVGHRAPSVEARYLAAVLACGEGACLSGRAAGHLLGLLKGSPPPPEVTARVDRRIPGIRTKRSTKGGSLHTATHRGIRVTTVPRTLVDLAGVLTQAELARACHEAGVLHRTTPSQVEAVLERRPNAPGARTLRRVMRGDERVTLSALERRFLARLAAVGLPLPQTNQRAGGRRADCSWPEHRLTVELDSYRYHGSRHAWEQDRRREREAHARGDDFRRYTHGDVFERPEQMLRELERLLSVTRSA